ncbi:DUF2019 domain-containing protein [Archangium gephyra]|nr:DUF2019 domain-containing protein [Archangium gephyra]
MKKTQLKKLPTEELVEKIRTLSAERWPAIYAGKPREANRMYDLLVAIERELKARGIEAQRQMLKLLDDPDPGTRCWVAGSVLQFAPAEGERVLTDIAAHVDGLVGFSAERTLEQWKAGTFNPPY